MQLRFLMFSEAHLLSFNSGHATALANLLDDKLTEHLVNFFDSDDFKNYINNSAEAQRLLDFEKFMRKYTEPIRIANMLKKCLKITFRV